MLNFISGPIDFIERKTCSSTVIAISAVLIGIGRTLLEIVLANRVYYGQDVLNNCVFYFVVAWGFTLVLSRLSRVDWRRVMPVVLAGLIVGMLPPLIDVFIYGPGNFVYTYYFGLPDLMGLSLFDRSQGMPFGEGLCLWAAVLFAAGYVLLKTGSWWRAGLSAVCVYLAVFALVGVAVPTFSRQLADFIPQPAMALNSLMQLLVGLLFYLCLRPKLLLSLTRRSLHCMPFVLICLIGAALHGPLTPMAILSAAAVFVAGLVALVQNDFYDREEDKISGREQAVEECDVHWFNLFFAGVFLSLYWGQSLLYLPIGCIWLLAMVYHHDDFRFKRIFPFNQIIEGLWGVLAYLAGALTVPNVLFSGEIAINAALIFVGWTLIAAFKDAKDLEADTTVGNRNFYTVMLGRGLSLERSHSLVCLGGLGFCLVPYAWLWLKDFPLAWSVGFPLATMPVMAAAYRYRPGRRGVAMILAALCYTLLLFLVAIMMAYAPPVAPR